MSVSSDYVLLRVDGALGWAFEKIPEVALACLCYIIPVVIWAWSTDVFALLMFQWHVDPYETQVTLSLSVS